MTYGGLATVTASVLAPIPDVRSTPMGWHRPVCVSIRTALVLPTVPPHPSGSSSEPCKINQK